MLCKVSCHDNAVAVSFIRRRSTSASGRDEGLGARPPLHHHSFYKNKTSVSSQPSGRSFSTGQACRESEHQPPRSGEKWRPWYAKIVERVTRKYETVSPTFNFNTRTGERNRQPLILFLLRLVYNCQIKFYFVFISINLSSFLFLPHIDSYLFIPLFRQIDCYRSQRCYADGRVQGL